MVHHLNKLGREEESLRINNIRGASALTDLSRWVVEVRRLSYYYSKGREKKLAQICRGAGLPLSLTKAEAREWLMVRNSKNNYLPRFPTILIRLFPFRGNIEISYCHEEEEENEKENEI